jgi:hypothetical protein
MFRISAMTPRLTNASAMAAGVTLLTMGGVSGLLSDIARYTDHGGVHWWLLRGYVGALVMGLTAVGVGMVAFHRFKPRPIPSAVAPMNVLFAVVLLGNSILITLGDFVLTANRVPVDLAAHAFTFLMALSIWLLWKKERRIMAQA